MLTPYFNIKTNLYCKLKIDLWRGEWPKRIMAWSLVKYKI